MLNNLTKDNITLGCQAKNKSEVISIIGSSFNKKNYVKEDCIPLINERELQVSTFLGNGVVLPHLPKGHSDVISKSGIEIFQFPDGVIWDRSNVMFIAVGVIAEDKEHIDLLREIASVFSDEIISNALSLITSKQDFMRIMLRSRHL